MNNMMVTQPHEMRGRSTKAERYAMSQPTNYIDPEIRPGHYEHLDRREHRLVKKRKAESYEHYLAIVRDEDGTWSVRSSDSLRTVKKLVLADSMIHIDNVFEVLEPRIEEIEDTQVSQSQSVKAVVEAPRESTISYPFINKRRRVGSVAANGLQCDMQMSNVDSVPIAGPSLPKGATGRKKPRRDKKMLQIRMDEQDKWYEWMRNAFKAIQQTACRSIAKEWIKAIHPKKQSTHPYNGNMPRNSRMSPDRTRPPYWPPQIRHKEPDHIDKAARTELLTWLLMHTPQPEIVPDKDRKTDRMFKAKDLLAVLEQKQDEFVVPRMDMIREVIGIRVLLEGYEEGGTDPDATIDVVDWSESFRNNSTTKKRKDDLNSTTKGEDEIESNDPEDEETSGATLFAGTSEDDNVEASVQEDPSRTNMNGSFISNNLPHDVDPQPERSEPLQHPHDPFDPVPVHHHYDVSSTQAQQAAIQLNHNHTMQFGPHHGMTNDPQFATHGWPIASAPTSDMTGSFGDGMMMVSPPVTTMIDHNPYEGSVPLRPRGINGMMPAIPFHEEPHYYNVDQEMQRNYHMASMSGPQHNVMHHGFDSDMYSFRI